MRHDDLCDEFANICKEGFNDVEREPMLNQLSGEDVNETANTQDEARSDVRVRSFWSRYENAFFDFRGFYPHASSYRNKSIEQLYRNAENTKKKEYAQRISKCDHGSFTPMVMASTGSMGPEASVALKVLARRIAKKSGQLYCVTVAVLRSRLAFVAAKAALVCIRGSRMIRSKQPEIDVVNQVLMKEARLHRD